MKLTSDEAVVVRIVGAMFDAGVTELRDTPGAPELVSWADLSLGAQLSVAESFKKLIMPIAMIAKMGQALKDQEE